MSERIRIPRGSKKCKTRGCRRYVTAHGRCIEHRDPPKQRPETRAEAVARATRAAYLRALEDVRRLMQGRSSIGRSEMEEALDRLAKEQKR